MSVRQNGAKAVIGVKQLRRALREGTVRKVYIAADAEDRITAPVAQTCAESGIPCETVPTMKELGLTFGIEVGAAAAGELL